MILECHADRVLFRQGRFVLFDKGYEVILPFGRIAAAFVHDLVEYVVEIVDCIDDLSDAN